jgi:hypothetical protein
VARAVDKPVPVDSVQVEASFSRGIVRDSARTAIPEGGVYDAVDFMLERPGRAYKRGGWVNHSAVLPAAPSAVGVIHSPVRVVAISNGDLYDVTSETGPQALLVGSVGFTPSENPTEYVAKESGALILCESAGLARPKKVYTVGATGVVTLTDLGGTPPNAAHSAVYASRIVLAHGQQEDYVSGVVANPNRVWFSPLPDVEASWALDSGLDSPAGYLDTTYSISGLAVCQGILLVFSQNFCERIIGGVPPGTSAGAADLNRSGNMELQPVGGVGVWDARSIVALDSQVLFATESGAFTTNGVGFQNLMEKSDSSGILSYWRSLFLEHQLRTVVGGMYGRNYYFLSTVSDVGVAENFLCYLPTKTWWRTKNTTAGMFANGYTEQNTEELYAAMTYWPYVSKFSPVFRPAASNSADGNAVAVEPSLETRMFGSGPGLKAFGFGRVTYDMRDPGAHLPTLAVSQAVGIEADSFSSVVESPLPATTQAERKRFRLFKDSQGLHLRFAQTGQSAQTELLLAEVEHRSYGLPADGESDASTEYP